MGYRIHAEIEQKGFLLTNQFVGSALVDMYLKCKLFASAQYVFDNLLVRDVVTWTTMLQGYVTYGEGKAAVECLERMHHEAICPNEFTFVCSLKVFKMTGDTQKARMLHAQIEQMKILDKNIYVGSILLGIYADFGFFSEAIKVFRRLPVHDVVSWTALIAGFVEHGLAEEALKCLDQMQAEGVAPDSRTFSYGLKACSLTKAINVGTYIHTEIERKGLLEADMTIGNMLVDMYFKCGSLGKTKEVFNKCLIKDAVSWNLLMASYHEHEESEQVLQCYKQMLLEGIFPDDVSIILSLKVCGILQNIFVGLQLHCKIERNDYMGTNLCIGTALLDMYVKCGLLAKALEMFDKLPVRDVVSWNSLISGHVSHSCDGEALMFFKQMQLEGVCPDDVTLISILKACGQCENICMGMHIHAEIERQNVLEQSPAVMGALFNMYAKNGLLVKAQELFLVHKDVYISGLIDQETEDALQFSEQVQFEGFLPLSTTVGSYPISLTRSELINNSSLIKASLQKVEMADGGHNCYSISDYWDMRCLVFPEVQQTSDNLPIKNTSLWNDLIAACAEGRDGKLCLQFLDLMQMEGLLPDENTLIFGLQACGHARTIARGYEIHAEIEKRGLQGDVYVSSSLIDMYMKCGFLSTAKAIFRKLQIRDVVCWNVLMAGYLEHDCSKEVSNLMLDMQIQKEVPSVPTFLFSLKACGDMGAIDMIMEMHDAIVKKGLFENNFFIANSLIDGYSKCGVLSTAKQIFDSVSVRDIASWNSLISGYNQHGDSEKVFDVFNHMLKEGTRPDEVTFVIVLNACSRACFVDRIEKCYNAMIGCHGVGPTYEHYSCLIDLFGRAGHVDKAISLMRRMPSDQELVAWHSLLCACKDSENLKGGRVAFEHAMKLDKGDAVSYVLMSHLYAKLGVSRIPTAEVSLRDSHQSHVI
ncbi:hypothetical protein KP509_23G048800 [Ceratopteris richardii]|nr:hypothetical protein KP509_23G048800 [Ceratopteris richardii]